MWEKISLPPKQSHRKAGMGKQLASENYMAQNLRGQSLAIVSFRPSGLSVLNTSNM